MLITVLAISGTILGATAIAGLLMLYQIRQSTDTVSSAKAIFAADAGLEWRLYRFFKVDGKTCNPSCDGGGSGSCLQPIFQNNANFQASCSSAQPAGGKLTVDVKSTGSSGNTARAFEIVLQ